MLRKLVQQMAVQKFIDKKREFQAQRRDHRLNTATVAELVSHERPESRPDEIVAMRELYLEARRRLTPKELQIANLWEIGHSFPEIGERVFGSKIGSARANAVRMILHRAFLRVAKCLP
jgi:hypothetical protein